MKILFLDIDGVLNTYSTYHKFQTKRKDQIVMDTGYYLFDKNRVKLLNQFKKDVTIIMSTSWRFIYTPNDLYKMLYYNGYRRKSIFGSINRLIEQTDRGWEIYQCLISIKEKDPNYVIFDDDMSGMGIHEDRFIYVNGSFGLMQSHIDIAQELLKG